MSLSIETLAADTLRAWALDENLKAKVMAHPTLAAAARKVAHRYTAGPEASDGLRVLSNNRDRGHLGSIEYVGESVRDRELAAVEASSIIALIALFKTTDHTATVSFDLSHIGSVISKRLCLKSALEIAQAARDAGSYVMISAEGSDRTDLVLGLWERISADFPETGVTLQARLHRTPSDLERVVTRSGPIRIVKGAFLEPAKVAHSRNSAPMYAAYQNMTTQLVRSGHRVNIATHDEQLVRDLRAGLGDSLYGEHVEFETLQGLGTKLLDDLRKDGFSTREYVVYGPEWWLYVLNRIAEHPERAITALADLNP